MSKNLRYVVACRDRHECFALVRPAQGRFTFPDRESAAEWLGNLLAHNSDERLAEVYGDQAVGTFHVRQVECCPSHDPKCTIWPLTPGLSEGELAQGYAQPDRLRELVSAARLVAFPDGKRPRKADLARLAAILPAFDEVIV